MADVGSSARIALISVFAAMWATASACNDDDGDDAERADEVPRVWLFPISDQGGEQALIGGTLAYDATSDCFSLRESDEAVVWPEGTTGMSDGPGVVLPDGSTARVGDHITGTGGHHAGTIADQYGIAPECVTHSLAVLQFRDVTVTPKSSSDADSG